MEFIVQPEGQTGETAKHSFHHLDILTPQMCLLVCASRCVRVFCHCAAQTLPSLQGIQVKIDKSKKKNKNRLQYAAIQGVVWCASRKILVASGVASRLHREKDDIKQQTKATD